MLTTKLFSNLKQHTKNMSSKMNQIDEDGKNAILTIVGIALVVLWLALIIVALALTFIVIIGAEFFIFVLVSKGICFLLGSQWIGWGTTFLLYLIFIIIRSVCGAIKGD